MIDRKEIELLIRAQLKGGRDLESVTKSIVALGDALDEQAAAARRGESRIDELKGSLAALKGIQDQLGSKANDIGGFGRMADTLKKAEEKVKSSTEAFDKLQARIDKAGKATEKQTARLDKLKTAQEFAVKALAAQRAQYEQIADELRQAGVNTDDLVGSELRLRDAAAQVGVQLAKGNALLNDYSTIVRKARDESDRLADNQRKLAALQAGNAADAKLAAQQQVAAIKKVEQAEADRLAIIQAAGRAEQQDRARASAESELASLRDSEKFIRAYAEAQAKAAQEAERNNGLRKLANDAEDAARQYSTLTKASNNLRPRVVSLREAVDSLVNPAAAARSNLAGVEKEVKSLAAGIALSTGPVQEYADQFRKLRDAQKAIAAQAGLIDQFKEQDAALREVRQEFERARSTVQEYAAAVRQGGDAGAKFVKPLAEAEVKLKSAAAALERQAAAVRASREALRNAGIDADNLAAAEARLVASTKQATQALDQLTKAGAANGEATTKASKGFSLFRDEGRTTLSMTQRLRGELLALTTAYFGVQSAINVASDALKNYNEQQGLRSGLSFAFGDDAAKIGQEVEYIKQQADRLGVAFSEVSKAYTKFAAAAVKSGAPIQETRFIFESFAEAGRVLNLTPDQMNGLFNALGQSFSKGKIQAEELRQQIGERLPGAFAFAQEALKQFYPDLNKALEEGKVGAENLVLVAESVRKAAQSGLGKAIQSLDAEQQRFNNSVYEFKLAIAEAGFADAYIDLLRQITEYFKSADGKAFAQELALVARGFIAAASAAVEWRDEIQLIASVFVALLAGNYVAQIGTGMVGIASGLTAARIAAVLTTPVMLTLTGAVSGLAAAVGALIAGYSIGSYLYDQFAEVRVAGALLVTGIAELGVRVRYAFKEIFNDFPQIIANALKGSVNLFNNLFITPILNLFKTVADSLGLTKLSGALDKAIASITLTLDTTVSFQTSVLRSERDILLKQIEDIRQGMIQDALQREGVTLANPAKPTANPGKRANTLTGGDDAAIKKRKSDIEELEKALNALESKTLKKQGESLASLLEAVDKDYADLKKRIVELGGSEGAAFIKRFEEGKAALKLEVTKDFNAKLLKEQTDLQGKLNQLDAQAGRKNKQNDEARIAAIRTGQESLYGEIEKFRGNLIANNLDTAPADAQRTRLDALVEELQRLERLKIAKEELDVLEKNYNETIRVRDGLIAAVRAQQEAGAIDDVQAAQQINAINQQALPGILQAAQATREWAIANQAVFANPEQFALFLANLDASIAKVRQVKTEFTLFEQKVQQGALQGIDQGFASIYDNLAKILAEQQSVSDGFDEIGKSFLVFAAQFLKEIALMIIKLAIFNALKNSGNPALAAIGQAGSASVGVKHSGGVIGQASNRSRAVPSSWFANAPRYHTGGVVGLAADEYPAILQKNEEVLTASDPRNVLNGGGMGAKQAAPASQRFVLVDDRSRIAEAMAGAEGEQVTLVNIRKNIPTLRQWLKG